MPMISSFKKVTIKYFSLVRPHFGTATRVCVGFFLLSRGLKMYLFTQDLAFTFCRSISTYLNRLLDATNHLVIT